MSQSKILSLKFVIICLLVVLSELAIDMYLPAFSNLKSFFYSNYNLVQISLSAYILGLGISPIIIGPLSDSFGRKKLIISLVCIFSSLSFILIFITNIYAFIFVRFITGISAVFATVLAAAVLRDCFTGKQLGKAISITSMLWAIIPSIAPVIGGYILMINYHWQDIFLVIFIISLISLLLTIFFLPETLSKSQRQTLNITDKIKQYHELLSNKKFLSHTISSALTYSLFTAYITAAPVLLKINFNTSAIEIGWLQLIYAITYILGTLINSIIISKLGFSRSILIGKVILLIGIIGLLGLFINQSIFLLLIPMMIIQFSNGFTFPNYCTLALIPYDKLAGLAGALLVSIQLTICFSISFLITVLPAGNLTAYAIFIGIIVIGILILTHKES